MAHMGKRAVPPQEEEGSGKTQCGGRVEVESYDETNSCAIGEYGPRRNDESSEPHGADIEQHTYDQVDG